MKKTIKTEKIPIKPWLDDLEEYALVQAKNLANLPFAYKHIPIMPDSHAGYGMPIGSVLATKDVVVPNAVGVDIGCGMCAQKTSITHLDVLKLKEILSLAQKTIPVGANAHRHVQDVALMPLGHKKLKIVNKQFAKATKQIGSLGGGNHFIEIQKGSDGFVWVMIHSGSRNLGYHVAKHYNEIAIKLHKRYYTQVATKVDLAFLPLDTLGAEDYLAEMEYCVEFAFANRKLMMTRLMEAMEEVVGEFDVEPMINESHNFAAWEKHFGKHVLVHRKGATRAFNGQLGMIPGSQGTKSYIIKGLGNKDSFKSCAHGAGRRLSRRQARKQLDLKKEMKILNDQNIVHGIKTINELDEAPNAYKDIDEVMENQRDLVKILVELKPLAVMKG